MLQAGSSLLMSLVRGRKFSRRRMVTCCPNVGAGAGCCLTLFKRFVREGRVT